MAKKAAAKKAAKPAAPEEAAPEESRVIDYAAKIEALEQRATKAEAEARKWQEKAEARAPLMGSKVSRLHEALADHDKTSAAVAEAVEEIRGVLRRFGAWS